MKKSLISIIVPVYNVKDFLPRCLESILRQTYTNIEILLVNDGSSDGSEKICDNYQKRDNRIKVIHKSNGGLSDARNVALDILCGEYIMFVDSDDWISDNYVEELYSTIKEYNSDIVICNLIRSKNQIASNLEKKKKVEVYYNEEAIGELLYQRISTSVCAKLFKSVLWTNIRFEKGKLYEDVIPMYLVLQTSKKIVKTNKCDYYYFYREGSIVTRKFNMRKLDYVENCKILLGYIRQFYPLYIDAAISRLFWAEIHILVHMEEPELYLEIFNKLKEDIKKYRWIVVRDSRNTIKVKGVAILSFFGYKVLRVIYTLIK